jgi:hypothetical protein
LFVSDVVGPNVLKMAQISDSIITTINCLQGKKNSNDMLIKSVYCSVMVYATTIPTITPNRQLDKTKTIAS